MLPHTPDSRVGKKNNKSQTLMLPRPNDCATLVLRVVWCVVAAHSASICCWPKGHMHYAKQLARLYNARDGSEITMLQFNFKEFNKYSFLLTRPANWIASRNLISIQLSVIQSIIHQTDYLNHCVDQSIIQSVSQSIKQTISFGIHKLVNRSVCQSISQASVVGQSVNQAASQSLSQSISQSVN